MELGELKDVHGVKKGHAELLLRELHEVHQKTLVDLDLEYSRYVSVNQNWGIEQGVLARNENSNEEGDEHVSLFSISPPSSSLLSDSSILPL